MEPQLPNPNFGSEKAPKEPAKSEVVRPLPSTSETQPSQPIEELKSNQSHERQKNVVSNTPTTTLPTVIPAPTSDDDTSTGDPATDLSASDDDVIEKEWVNKSKKIVKDTKGDPYRKEHEVSKLQADYLHKRYGKEIKLPNDV